MDRQLGSFLIGIALVIGLASAACGAVLPEGSLTMGSLLEGDSGQNGQVPDVGTPVDSSPTSGYSSDGYYYGNYHQTSYLRSWYNQGQRWYNDGYRMGCSLLRRGSCCHCHNFGCNCYTWKPYVGALFWTKTSPGGGTVLTDGDNLPLVDSNDYNLTWRTGWEVGLQRRLGCVWAAEMNFYRIDSFNAAYPPFTSTGTGIRVPYHTPVGTTGVTTVTSNFSTELTNLSLDLRRHLTERIDFVFGFRYIQLNDRYQAGLATTQATQTHNIHAYNNMYGFHFGPDVCLFKRGPFCLEWDTRLGVYGNRIDSGVVIAVDGDTQTQGGGNEDHTAFSADMKLAGTYQHNDHLAFRFGYQVLWLEGVGEATSQIPQFQLLNGHANDANVDTDGSPFFHGAFIDVVLTW